MIIALTIWNGDVATVADFTRHLQLIEVVAGRVQSQCKIDAPGDEVACWCARLAALEVTTVICGGITRQLAERLTATGITVLNGCVGPADRVLAAWLDGSIDQFRWPVRGGRR